MPSFCVSSTILKELETIQAVFKETFGFFARFVGVDMYSNNCSSIYYCIFKKNIEVEVSNKEKALLFHVYTVHMDGL